MTQREMCARYMAARPNEWIAGHELVRRASSIIGQDYIIQDADTRSYELTKEGFRSPNFDYSFETEKRGKYAYFRCTKRVPRQVLGLRDWTHGQPTHEVMV